MLSNSKRGREWRFRCANGKCLGTLCICKLVSGSLIAQQACMAGCTAFITAAMWCSGDQWGEVSCTEGCRPAATCESTSCSQGPWSSWIMTFCLSTEAQRGCCSVADVKQNAIHQTFMSHFTRGCILKDEALESSKENDAALCCYHLMYFVSPFFQGWETSTSAGPCVLLHFAPFRRQMTYKLNKEGMAVLKNCSHITAGTSFQLYSCSNFVVRCVHIDATAWRRKEVCSMKV